MAPKRLLTYVLLLAGPAFSQTRWIRVHSDNLELYSTAPEARAKETLRGLEQVRSFYSQLQASKPSKTESLCVVALKADEEYARYKGDQTGIVFTVGGPDRDYLVVDLAQSGGFEAAAGAYGKLLTSQSGLHFPAWLDQGLGEFYGSFTQRGGQTLAGDVSNARRRALSSNTWVPLETILHSGPGASPSLNEAYGLVHLLALHPDYAPKFKEVVAGLSNGANSQTVLEKAYGKPLSLIETELRGYVATNRFGGTPLAPTPENLNLSTPETAPQFDVNLVLSGVNNRPGREGDAAAWLERLAKEDPMRAEIWTGMGYLALRQGKPDLAAQDLQKAASFGGPDPKLTVARLRQRSSNDTELSQINRVAELLAVGTKITLASNGDAEAKQRAADTLTREKAELLARQKAEELTRVKAEAEAAAKAAEEARAKELAEVREKAGAAAREKEQAKAQAKSQIEANLKAMQEARAQEAADAKEKIADAARQKEEAKAKMEANLKLAQEARLKEQAEAREKALAAAREKEEAKTQAREKALADAKEKEQAKTELAAKLKEAQEARAKEAAEAREKALAEAKEKEEAKAQAKALAEANQKAAAEARAKELADARERAAAEAKEKAEAKARQEANVKLAQEARAKEAAEAREKAAAEAREKAEAKAREAKVTKPAEPAPLVAKVEPPAPKEAPQNYGSVPVPTLPPGPAFPAMVSGTFVELGCGEQIKVVLQTESGKKNFVIKNPANVIVSGPKGGTVDLECGPQKATTVKIQYGAPDTASLDGLVQAIYFQ
jgi:hypothetical protein